MKINASSTHRFFPLPASQRHSHCYLLHQDPERNDWFAGRGFVPPSSDDEESSSAAGFGEKHLWQCCSPPTVLRLNPNSQAIESIEALLPSSLRNPRVYVKHLNKDSGQEAGISVGRSVSHLFSWYESVSR